MDRIVDAERNPSQAATDPALQPSIDAGRFGEGSSMDLRSRTAHGTIVNAIFMIGVSSVSLVQAVLLARLVPVEVLGLWGLLMAAFMTLIALGSVGIDDKYIQQDDPDQQRAFEIAFTLQMLVGLVFVVVVLVGIPAFALVYGQPEIVAPGIVLALTIPLLALQMPLWAHYRRMDFVRQRTLQAIDPVVTLVATVALVLAGLELWGLVLGAITGSAVATAAMVATSPYRLRLRWDRAAFREYTLFSWPLLVAAGSTMLLVQVPMTVAARVLGVSAVAAITFAGTIARFTTKVDGLITDTLYPAICAVKDRPDLLFESFWKSNRLALLWATPLGAATALFAGDFVHYVIGEKWRFAAPLIGAFGIAAVINQIGFNWSAFFRALGDTRPLAVGNGVSLGAVLAIAVPLLVTAGVTGYGIGVAAAAVVAMAVRLRYLRRIFPGLAMARHVARGLGPTVPAVIAILAVRAVDGGPRGPGRVVAEALLYVAIAAAATYASERALLREAVGYLRGARIGRPASLTSATG